MGNKSITLGTHYDAFVNGLLGSKQYTSRSEIVRTGLRLLEREIERHEFACGKEKQISNSWLNDLEV